MIAYRPTQTAQERVQPCQHNATGASITEQEAQLTLRDHVITLSVEIW